MGKLALMWKARFSSMARTSQAISDFAASMVAAAKAPKRSDQAKQYTAKRLMGMAKAKAKAKLAPVAAPLGDEAPGSAGDAAPLCDGAGGSPPEPGPSPLLDMDVADTSGGQCHTCGSLQDHEFEGVLVKVANDMVHPD